jgi:hypothetical protein
MELFRHKLLVIVCVVFIFLLLFSQSFGGADYIEKNGGLFKIRLGIVYGVSFLIFLVIYFKNGSRDIKQKIVAVGIGTALVGFSYMSVHPILQMYSNECSVYNGKLLMPGLLSGRGSTVWKFRQDGSMIFINYNPLPQGRYFRPHEKWHYTGKECGSTILIDRIWDPQASTADRPN